MFKYTNEQAEYNVDEQEHEDKEVQLAKYLNRIGWNFHSRKCLIQIISIKNAEEADCTFHGPIKLGEKIYKTNYAAVCKLKCKDLIRGRRS